MVKKIITIVFFCIICVRLGSLFYQNRDKYKTDYWSRYETLKNVYGESQYMMKDWKYWIPDETGYAYAAGAYAKGANPILVESTQPPLGKYMLALSVSVFNNENVILAVSLVVLLVGLYWLSLQIFKNSAIAFLPVLLFLFDPLFANQLTYTPLLDVFHVMFVVWGIACIYRGLDRKAYSLFIFGVICIGFSMFVKVWVSGMVFLLAIGLYILLRKRDYLKYFIVGCLGISVVLLAVYTQTVISGYSPIDILKVQKWLLWYHQSKFIDAGTIWPLVFLNQWHVWWGNVPIIRDANWYIGWPISIAGGAMGSLVYLLPSKKKRSPALFLIVIVIFGYAAYLSLGQASARYLLPLLPFCYVMTVWLIIWIGYRYILKRGNV